MTIFERIKAEADKQGLTIIQLAKKTGISEPTFYNWDSPTVNVNGNKLLKVADVLHVSLDYLYGRGEIGQLTPQQYTIADHADPDMTDEQLKKVNEYIDFIQNKKK
ncbi:helix-turn-helix domain-containing protein [Oenococcus sicerae]|uniref:XRE family transcriptional regulator n=1 Tax=Oenococcus sicerae TaxID=2203724 RepID=A0AAJ1VMU6_9LACO|nr:helix-turn-helix transcriptional regulator [Oenococcus sicerae]MDN6899539.1 XRE family transcriptional regulator [Oenococcus sicerae]